MMDVQRLLRREQSDAHFRHTWRRPPAKAFLRKPEKQVHIFQPKSTS
jgi:hypothetical protein